MIGTVALVAVWLMIASCLWLGVIRNGQVFRERQRVLEDISAAARDDIARGDYDWHWRYRAMEEITYDRMMLSVRPVRSFFRSHPARQKKPFEVIE